MKSSPSVINNPYIIVDKPGQVINMAASSSAATGTYIASPPWGFYWFYSLMFIITEVRLGCCFAAMFWV